jgi:hypothetical protein
MSTDNSSAVAADDRVAIASLLHRYSDAVTCGDLEHDEELFIPDAVIELGAPFDTRIEGSAAIAQWRRDASAAMELLIHSTYSSVVRLLGPGRAEARSQTREMVRSANQAATAASAGDSGLNVVFYSIYTDDIVKVDDDWRFARRVGQPTYMETGTLLGQVCTTRSMLARRP